MYAKSLERILSWLCRQADISNSAPDEYAERFKSLRGSNLLPRGRDRRGEELSKKQIAAAIFGLVPYRPGWAAMGATILSRLRPVGGPKASFFEAETLSDAVELLLSDPAATESLVRLSATLAETGINSNGGATLLYQKDGERRSAYFVPELAVSLTAPGREVGFDPEKHRLKATAGREMSFSPDFFRRLARECELAKLYPAMPEGDGSEYDEEEAQRERNRRLGVRSGSRFLNIGVDNQVTWPNKETVVKFDRYTLVLMPRTEEKTTSIHIDLTLNRLNDLDALTVINRFLSVMVWCDDSFAITQDGWAGNPVPVAVPRRNLAFTTTYHYVFNRNLPESEEALRALALYREARNAQQNEFISYAVLNFYKIIEIRNHGKEAVRKWFRKNFESLHQMSQAGDDIERFLKLCGTEPPEKYIHNSCRIAVAHAGKYSKSDPDDAHEVVRLHTAARIMRLLARRFIENEFRISELMYSGD